MIRRRQQSISTRLTRMNLMVSGVVLLMAALAFFSYDLVSFRQNLITNLDAAAQIVGENSISALTFDDQQSAAATLASLRHSPDVLGAVLTSSNGSAFAGYRSSSQIEVRSHLLAPHEISHVWSSGSHVLVARRVIFQGKPVGIVYISARLTEMGQRTRRYLLTSAVILFVCMIVAIVISSASRRLIATPIIALADTALLVSRDRDYSIRAPVHTDGSEIAVLINAFNAMLAQIEERDAALNDARADLESRVEERTSELRSANRELEAFSYTVAHDLRGPLDAISGIVFLLAQSFGEASDPNVELMLEQLKTSAANMGSLIDDLLNFARASTKKVQAAPVDLSAIAREIVFELITSDPARHVDFVISDIPEVITDAGLMRIALDNLLRNAWKYTSHHVHACIEFGASIQKTGQPVYFVRDDGAGFDPSQMGELFQPFHRLHNKGDFPGTGIGLATVQRILGRQGGSIWAEAAVEKGATFYFTLS